ncbi:DUF350 domain-containing protein [Agarilytica rhodophyticola]|uniref:DUF350 domain-containing protein n=1 Tax=Agarilytica rhodophyticola TaxID=1737490 RepID=UPI000B342F84|nr:DUF350 domain-containing protein [Agarilytica rhodophyticola]
MNAFYISALAINLVIVIAVLFCYRHVQAKIAGVSSNEELADKDNYAFGVSVAGGLLALCFMLAAAVSGDIAGSLAEEAINVLSYALVGVVLLKLGMLINDNLLMRGFSVGEQLRQKNMAVGVVNGSNLVAQGIITSAAIKWVETDSWQGLGFVVMIWLVSQVVISLVTFIRMSVYKRRHNGSSWQTAIEGNNAALAIRFAGQIIAAAITVKAASNMVAFLPLLWMTSMASLLLYSLGLVIVVWGIYRIVLPTVLYGVNVVEEVDSQGNIGIAFIEAGLFISIALILLSLLA